MPLRIPKAAAAAAAGAASQPRWKIMIWTVGFASIIFTGTIYGAGLKFKSEHSQARKKAEEATAEDKIAILQDRRAHLVQQKFQLEKKLSDLQARVEARERGGGVTTR